MPKYAEIQNGIVTNVFVADVDFVILHKPEAKICPDEIGVGDKYEDGEFSRVIVIVEDEPLP